MTNLQVSLAVVTGAGGAIGAAVSRRLRAEGCQVLAVDRDDRALRALSDESDDYFTQVADVGDATERTAVVKRAGELGGARYLVNAAGILRARPLPEVSPDDFRAVSAVNVEAAFFLGRDLASAMPSGGAIVNIGSSAAKTGTTTELAVYAASKAGLASITRSLAFAYASAGIRVNCVAPGAVDTTMQERLVATIATTHGAHPADVLEARVAAVPLGRLATAREVAEVAWFLLSPAASYMTGQSINMTGGLVTW